MEEEAEIKTSSRSPGAIWYVAMLEVDPTGILSYEHKHPFVALLRGILWCMPSNVVDGISMYIKNYVLK